MKNFVLTPFATVKARQAEARKHGFLSLLGIDTNAKTVKGQKFEFKTAIMYLSPTIETCPAAKLAACLGPCLNTAGRGAMQNVQDVRAVRTALWLANPELFLSILVHELESIVRRSKKWTLELLVRLNGTSDIKWELISFTYKGKFYANIFALFPEVQFYDYSKLWNRDFANMPANYDLTISYSEASELFADRVLSAMQDNPSKLRMAVVFRDSLPAMFRGYSVVDGDSSDIRHLDKTNVVVGLIAKGKAKKDHSGFVVDTHTNLIDIVEVA